MKSQCKSIYETYGLRMSIYYRADIIHSNGTMSPLDRTNITENQLILKIEKKNGQMRMITQWSDETLHRLTIAKSKIWKIGKHNIIMNVRRLNNIGTAEQIEVHSIIYVCTCICWSSTFCWSQYVRFTAALACICCNLNFNLIALKTLPFSKH